MKSLNEYISNIMESTEKIIPENILQKLKEVLPHRKDIVGVRFASKSAYYKSKSYNIFWQENDKYDLGGYPVVSLGDNYKGIKNETLAYNVIMEYIKQHKLDQ